MNRSSYRFIQKNSIKANVQKTKELHEEAIKYMEEHIETLKSIPADEICSRDLEKDIGLSTYILQLLKGLRKTFNKIG